MKKIFTAALLAVSALSLGGCMTTIDDNQIGLERVYGEIQDAPVKGFQMYNPWSTDIITFDNQQTPINQDSVMPTHDQQRAHLKSVTTVQLSARSAASMYRNVGQDWAAKIVPQVIKSVQLSVVGGKTAVEVIQKQAEVESAIKERLVTILGKRGILITDYQITEVKFSDDYMNAVEAKATATQKAEFEKNKTVQIQEQGRQRVITATAEADAMRVRASALETNPKLIEYERLSVERAAIDAWKSGGSQVPTYVMGGSGAGVPFVNVPLGTK